MHFNVLNVYTEWLEAWKVVSYAEVQKYFKGNVHELKLRRNSSF